MHMKAQSRAGRSGHNIQTTRKPSRAGIFGKKPRRNLISAAQFRDARVFSGMTREDAADFLNVSVRTVGHWETGRARPSYAAFRLLRVYRHGELIDPAWRDWKLIGGRLYTPEGHAIAPQDCAWWSLFVRRAHFFTVLTRERDALQARVDRLEEQGRREAAALGLVYSSTSGTRPPENSQKQGISVSFRVACNGAIMGPSWPHERRDKETQSEVAHACGRGSQGPSGGVGGVLERLHPVRHWGAGEAGSCGTAGSARQAASGVSSEGGCGTSYLAAGAGVGRSRCDSGEAAASEGWAERSVPLWQWSQGEAMSSGVDLTGGVH